MRTNFRVTGPERSIDYPAILGRVYTGHITVTYLCRVCAAYFSQNVALSVASEDEPTHRSNSPGSVTTLRNAGLQ